MALGGETLFGLNREALPGFGEMVELLFDLPPSEQVMLAGAVLWGILLAMPLSGVDRRDGITSLTYCGLTLVAGIILLVAVPGVQGSVQSAGGVLAAGVVMVALSLARWHGSRLRPARRQEPVVEHVDEKEAS